MEILAYPIMPVLMLPYLAGIPVIFFTILFYLRKHKPSASAAVFWFVYGVYEFLMYERILCSNECNIRIDLLIIGPVVTFISILAFVLWLRAKPNK